MLTIPAASRHLPARQRGSTFVGLLIGIVLGLAIAVATALFVTKVSVPFLGGDQKTGESIRLPGDKPEAPESTAAATTPPGTLPDPNQTAAARTTPRPAAGGDGSGSVASVTVGSDTPPVPAGPGADVSAAPAGPAPSQPITMPPPSRSGSQAPIQVAVPSARDAVVAAAGDSPAVYLLQAGAYRSPTEAESMKAKLALMGFETQVVTADISGSVLHRVRVGPYTGLDSMNRARARLAENGIEATVLRQR